MVVSKTRPLGVAQGHKEDALVVRFGPDPKKLTKVAVVHNEPDAIGQYRCALEPECWHALIELKYVAGMLSNIASEATSLPTGSSGRARCDSIAALWPHPVPETPHLHRGPRRDDTPSPQAHDPTLLHRITIERGEFELYEMEPLEVVVPPPGAESQEVPLCRGSCAVTPDTHYH